ncbi:MAG TPA: hypothetical protein VKV04_06700 [Verrucomicrobiae bacterium]|nr:hypothetical protein [Verrucomicrobiae bacterium]
MTVIVKITGIKGRFCRPLFVAWKAGVAAALLLLAGQLSSAEQTNSDDVKLAILKVGSEVYSNVSVTMVTTTDIYFTYSGGMGNARLEKLTPDLQRKFHFNAKKALATENEERQANARFNSWARLQTNFIHVETPPAVSIEVAEPTIEYKYYNLSQGKPEEMSELNKLAIGDTYSPFICDVDLDVRRVRGTDGQPFAFHIEAIKMSVALPVTITLPLGALQKLKDHEEGHHHIDKYFYAVSRKAAERAIQVTLTNKIPTLNAKDPDSAEEDFVLAAKRMAQMEYWKYTLAPSRPANEYYDKLTDHGRNDLDSAEAAEKAIQRYVMQIPDDADGIASADEAVKR